MKKAFPPHTIVEGCPVGIIIVALLIKVPAAGVATAFDRVELLQVELQNYKQSSKEHVRLRTNLPSQYFQTVEKLS